MAWDRDKEKKAAKNMSIGTSIFAIVFLLIWIAVAPSFMKLFGLAFLGLMIYRLYVFVQLNREEEKPRKEAEPWDRPAMEQPKLDSPSGGNGFCPYCGGRVEETFAFCPQCGRRLP